MRRTAIMLAAALTGFTPAAAQTDQDAARAAIIREDGARAREAFAGGDFDTAAKLYTSIEISLQALEGRERELSIVQFNLGRCYDELGRAAQAIQAYERSITGPLDAALRQRIQDRIDALRAGALGRLEVKCDVDGARVSIKGRAESGACGRIFAGLNPGAYVVVGRHPDGRKAQSTVEVVAGESATVTLFVPGTMADPDPGRETPGGSDTLSYVAWGLTGGAALSLAIGGGYTLAALDRIEAKEAAEARARPLPEGDPVREMEAAAADAAYNAALDRIDTSYIFYGLGGALAAGAVAVWIIDGVNDDQTALVPLIGPNAIGIGGIF